VKGYAWSGDGREIVRVDVSSDQGRTWQTADIETAAEETHAHRSWAWTLWSSKVLVPPGNNQCSFI